MQRTRMQNTNARAPAALAEDTDGGHNVAFGQTTVMGGTVVGRMVCVLRLGVSDETTSGKVCVHTVSDAVSEFVRFENAQIACCP